MLAGELRLAGIGVVVIGRLLAPVGGESSAGASGGHGDRDTADEGNSQPACEY